MTCASMIESVRVHRRCWMGYHTSNPDHRIMPALVHFKISWTTPAGHRLSDSKMFDGVVLLGLPRGAVPMVTHIYTLPYPGHPGACTPAIAYLMRVYDYEKDLEDVVARMVVRPDYHGRGPDETFFCAPMEEHGPDIYDLPIHDVGEPLG